MDMTQDSDNNNSKVKKLSKKIQGVATDGFDNVNDYFESPKREDGKPDGPKNLYTCKWCAKVYKKGENTQHNLKLHQDGNLTRAACPARKRAIFSGANLPITPKEQAAANREKDADSSIMAKFLKTTSFDNHEAHRLYLNLQDKVLATLQSVPSKMTLIHDVWTTKGNRQAFLGIAVTYINEDWVFRVSHLSLKMLILFCSIYNYIIAQTTNSGSNNQTMTAEVDCIVLKETNTDMDLTNNHIRCFCHKIALILTAGLKAIDVGTNGLTENKKGALGFIPKLGTIAEACKVADPTDTPGLVPDNDQDLAELPNELPNNFSYESAGGSDTDDDGSAISEAEETPLTFSLVLSNVDFVIHRITSSAAKRSEFSVWSKKLDYVGPSLIAGRGIRWNVKWQSRDRAYQG
ncbi:hypothetical protein PTTG_29252 [Puccinia triticina 1-1 BBBD Race 1]|uniref:Uncharacterized protein n=1 Tax=Puccinia triticina (isolate 1-1 / race 1 (BBBD)) TaxID=630390 RepID=A0A180G5A6_PUCT1|nr:hypothetical protein PTTG_29252 [Puccinia triticina 1-1 BBBD Race 1]